MDYFNDNPDISEFVEDGGAGEEDVSEDEEEDDSSNSSFEYSGHYPHDPHDDPYYLYEIEGYHPYFNEYTWCNCRICAAFKKLKKMYLVEGENRDVTKVDIYLFTQLLFKATEELDLAVSLKFLPKLFKKIKDQMKYKLQEDLVDLLYFPGQGYLPHTVVLQIAEILLESTFDAVTGVKDDFIKFEENSVSMKKTLRNILNHLEELDNEIFLERSDKIFSQRFNFLNCNIELECCKELPGPILMLLNEVKVLIPEFSIEAEQYEAFLAAIEAPYLRGYVTIEKRDVEKIEDQLGYKDYITCIVYALWKKIDNVVEALLPHLMTHDIVALCKIHQLNSK